MLANGARLGYREKGASSEYKDLPGLKEIPDMGVETDKEDNTCLTDPHKMYEAGIGDLPDMVYKFRYDNTKADSPYRLMREAQAANKVLEFKETLKDGTTTEFEAEVAVKRTGGGVNSVIDSDVTVIVQSEFTYTDPA